MRFSVLPLSRTPAAYRMPARPSLRAIVQIIVFEWRSVAVYALAAALLGGIYCLVTPKVYESSVQIVPGDFTTKTSGSSAANLATLLLSGPTQSDSVRRFVTVLYSPDMARRLVMQNRDAVLVSAQPGWLETIVGSAPEKKESADQRVRKFQSAISSIQFADDKKTMATRFYYRATSPNMARDFLRLAVNQGDELLRQYNLSEIRYDDAYLNTAIGKAQVVDVRMALAQKLVETQLRRMDAERTEYFSIRTLGPVEVSEGPVWPRKKLILAGMLILGTLIGLVAAFIKVYAKNRDQDDAVS
jgi:LPS O-antigen subunit length determinant protein (WzzB/FepE family)